MNTEPSSSVEGILEDAVANYTVPGAAFVRTGSDGLTSEVTAGALSVNGSEPVSATTMFRLMSMTKALATVGALQLVEQGRLSLDQDVASVLPEWGDVKVLDGFDVDTPLLREPRQKATVKHLMTHTAGHAYAFLNEELLRYHQVTGAPDTFSGQLAYLQAPLVADPGVAWNYGINTDWLGRVIEAISGQDLAAYLEEHLFSPLGMSDATFAPSPEQRSRLMSIHARTPDGGLNPIELDAPMAEPEFWPAGHGAYATATDFARFMAALLAGGELDGARILRPETVDLMFTDHLGAIQLPEEMKSAIPEFSNNIPKAPFAQGWGLGLHLFTEDLPGMRHAGSGDWAGLMNCYYWIDRTAGMACAFLTQVLPFYDLRIVETALAAEQAVYSEIASPA